MMHRVVLDTNIVLSSLIFSRGQLAWIRHTWQQGHLVPLVCKQTVSELLRVLAYPKFKLTAKEREKLLADFLPYTESVTLPEPWPDDVPVCRDKKDQPFLVLACVANADALVSGDKDILSMQNIFPRPVLSADELSIAVAEKIAALEAENFFMERAKRADFEKFRALLTRQGGEPPQPDDEV
jgi:putative PIN family toxin of toxin-antitoxin system